jgi:hypothetical protein
MVDALRHAHRIVTANGCVVDLHPTAERAVLEVGPHEMGLVEAGDAPARHAAAEAAIAAVAGERLFVVERAVDFTFYTYGDTIDELRDYIVEDWRNARIDAGTIDRARDALRAAPGTRPRVREYVRATRLHPITANSY